MNTVVEAVRQVIGYPDFYRSGELDYDLFVEYLFSGLLVLVVVSFVFKIILKILK